MILLKNNKNIYLLNNIKILHFYSNDYLNKISPL